MVFEPCTPAEGAKALAPEPRSRRLKVDGRSRGTSGTGEVSSQCPQRHSPTSETESASRQEAANFQTESVAIHARDEEVDRGRYVLVRREPLSEQLGTVGDDAPRLEGGLFHVGDFSAQGMQLLEHLEHFGISVQVGVQVISK